MSHTVTTPPVTFPRRRGLRVLAVRYGCHRPAASPTGGVGRRTTGHPRLSGFTLLELLLALAINCVIFTAVGVLVYGGVRTDSYLQSCNTAEAEVELAMRRIMHNLHTAQSGSITLGTGTLTIITAADNNSYNGTTYPNGATVTYSLQTDPLHSTQKLLVESDPRYGNTANTLAHNVTTFTIAAVSGVSDLYQVDLVTGTAPVAERHIKVFGRN
jgi:prepilin-type N-terminal cleavage/methylation domain-containing protein